MMKIVTLLFILSIFAFRLLAQNNNQQHNLTPVEEQLMPDYLKKHDVSIARHIPMAPPTKVRTMAEWEQIQAVTIAWTGQATILKEIVRNAVKECKVLIITTDSTTVTNQLTNAGIPLDSVRFVVTPFNSIWVCDYGAWSVYSNDVDSLWQIDWIYNRPRPQDDATPAAVADYLHIPLYEATVDPDDFVHTGGNHFSDGLHNAFSSMLVLEENSDKTEDEIDTIAKKYLGVEQYVKFPTLPYDGIHHLDMHMRIIDEETIIVGEYPDGVADGPQINANIEYLNNEIKTSFGHKYRIIRMPMPPDANNRYPDHGGNYRTYTNAVFLNKTLLVPTYEEKYDTTALRIYRENLPGYNVVGINCNSIISSLGALHCITKLVGVTDPLLIAHARLRDSDNAEQDYPVTAYIRHSSGIEGADLYYRLADDSVYNKVIMSISDTLQNIWSAVIPAQVSGSEVQYYIKARSNSGKEQVRPIVAPKGYFNFRIKEQLINQPPTTTIIYPPDQSVFSIDLANVTLQLDAEDADGTVQHLVVYINSDSIATINTLPYTYDWQFPNEGEYEIRVKATDNDGAETWSTPVHISVEGTTGFGNVVNANVRFFPNPVEDVLWIRNDDHEVAKLFVTDLIGQSLSIPKVFQEEQYGLDFSLVAPGIYLIKSIVDGHFTCNQVVKR
ncbi:MAG: agmatine deiminase family protein [Saprospiraceae bacterium]|uniref:Agmatine deiminase family protein n=1 Tax=Candidatus Opimibacter skivensis TaxID=2982028 RepID=A0A9D7XSF0_9BACT|nr:agmatine deiminase family protein [Candidatus Opimibacter skivensis]